MREPARIEVGALRLADLVSREVTTPDLQLVRRVVAPAPSPLDVVAAIAAELGPALDAVLPGQSVAVGVGSRGVARIGEIVTAVLALLTEHGAVPYVVPAMGSHGGGTPEGQVAVLADLGFTEATTGVLIRPAMATRVLGDIDGVTVHHAESLAGADHVLVVNRLKSHTSFTGKVESGLAKMVAIGLGKQRGAEELHRLGPLHLERRIKAACSVIRDHVPLLGGIAVVEDDRKGVDSLTFLTGDEIGGPREAELLTRARAQEARLPFEHIDVLVVDTMGKEISGTGMDTNVLGRRMVRGSPEPPGVDVTNVVVLAVTEGSEGNAVGLGLADFAPVSVLDHVDLHATYANALTAGLQGVQRAQVPVVLATDRDAFHAALMTAGLADPGAAVVVRIRSTLALNELMVSPHLVAPGSGLEPVGDVTAGADLFDENGTFAPWPTTTDTTDDTGPTS